MKSSQNISFALFPSVKSDFEGSRATSLLEPISGQMQPGRQLYRNSISAASGRKFQAQRILRGRRLLIPSKYYDFNRIPSVEAMSSQELYRVQEA